jgi:hypothetical protein
MYPLYYIYYMSQLFWIALTKLKPTQNWGVHYLKQLEVKYNGNFDETVIKKVAKFQSIQLHFVAASFARLFSRSLSQHEMELNIKYITMTSLYDDLIDNDKANEALLNQIFYHPELVNPASYNERVLVALHMDLLNQVADRADYWYAMENIHIAQKDSSFQFDKNTSVEKIIDITKRKGGFSLLMFRHYLSDPKYTVLDECWYTLGGLIQMTNDLYDTYKDTQEGIRTFANQLQNVEEIEAIYKKQKDVLKSQIQKLPMSMSRKIEFSILISVIPSFGDIAIQQLKRIQGNSSSLPNFNEITRKELIIDMEKPSNIIRLFQFAFKNGNLWK